METIVFVVFDLDGTLADIRHRLHHIKEGKPDWDAFYAACDKDTPMEYMMEVLVALQQYQHHVEIWSGRGEGEFGENRDKTEIWLQKYLGDMLKKSPVKFEMPGLKMKPYGDHTDDMDLKRKWLYELRSTGMNVDLAFEDRKRVVDMWREANVQCCQVAKGDF